MYTLSIRFYDDARRYMYVYMIDLGLSERQYCFFYELHTLSLLQKFETRNKDVKRLYKRQSIYYSHCQLEYWYLNGHVIT